MYILISLALVLLVAGFIRAWIFYAYVPVIKLKNEDMYSKIKGNLTGSFEYAPGSLTTHEEAYPRFYEVVVKKNKYEDMPKYTRLAFQATYLVVRWGIPIYVISFVVFVAFALSKSPFFK